MRRRHRFSFVKFIFGVMLFVLISSHFISTAAEAHSRYNIVDAHLHYLDFTQETDGLEKLVLEMDKAGISRAVLFGMPMVKQWDEHAPNMPVYYLSNDSRSYYYSATDYIMMAHLERQPDDIKDRFYPFICGINPNDKYAAKYIKQLLDTYPGQFYGIGELMSRHDDLTALTYGEPPRANHPAMLEIYDLAAEYNLPVMVHHNVAGYFSDEPIYLEEMQQALAHNRNTNFIWPHVGISRRIEIPNLIEITREMLTENDNLYYDISWIVFEEYILKDLEGWAELISEFPERFMVGSDIVGHWGRYAEEVTKFYLLLDLLDDETAQKVSGKNIVSLVENGVEKRQELQPSFIETRTETETISSTAQSNTGNSNNGAVMQEESNSDTLIIIAVIFSTATALIALIISVIFNRKQNMEIRNKLSEIHAYLDDYTHGKIDK
ncbi:MAG: amidohydrolase [Oscillospiraceae bacterium]|nr:amidohydrolase [Oscillospiraceae bacterium]